MANYVSHMKPTLPPKVFFFIIYIYSFKCHNGLESSLFSLVLGTKQNHEKLCISFWFRPRSAVMIIKRQRKKAAYKVEAIHKKDWPEWKLVYPWFGSPNMCRSTFFNFIALWCSCPFVSRLCTRFCLLTTNSISATELHSPSVSSLLLLAYDLDLQICDLNRFLLR